MVLEIYWISHSSGNSKQTKLISKFLKQVDAINNFQQIIANSIVRLLVEYLAHNPLKQGYILCIFILLVIEMWKSGVLDMGKSVEFKLKILLQKIEKRILPISSSSLLENLGILFDEPELEKGLTGDKILEMFYNVLKS